MNWRSLGKVLSVVSALALGGTYVAYRQKQSGAAEPVGEEKAVLPSLKNPNRVTVFPSSKNIDAVIPPGSPGLPRTHSDFILPSDVEPADKEAAEMRRKLLAEIQHLWDDDVGNSSDGAEGNGGKKRTLLPSSKIGAILSPDDAPINRNNIDAILDEQKKKQEPEEKK